jgi:hypothetical protein
MRLISVNVLFDRCFSVQYKFYLKLLYMLHIIVLFAMWAKVGSEFAMRELGYKSEFFKRLDLPSAYPWEYVWCLSFVPIILGFASFSHNKVRMKDLYKHVFSLNCFESRTIRSSFLEFCRVVLELEVRFPSFWTIYLMKALRRPHLRVHFRW